MRSLTLLGLVVLFAVTMGSSAWAVSDAYLRQDKDPASFPYLSPVPAQRGMLVNAFNFQMNLFGAINGSTNVTTTDGAGATSTTGGVQALRYLAMAATLAGALLIIFNPKNRKPITISTWLLLVVITMFAPYGSKLLFYPLGAKNSLTQGLTGATVASGDCMTTPATCGFTPQLAALHLASVLQMTFSDIFNSMQWKTLIGQSISKGNLATNAKLIASPEWPAKIAAFSDACGSDFDWNALMAYRHAGGTTADPNDRYVMSTLGDQWGKISKIYTNPDQADSNTMYPPQAIQLFDESDYPTDPAGTNQPVNSWAGSKGAYVAGINGLYKAVTGDINTTVAFDAPDGQGTSISIKKALAAMDQKGFFNQDTTKWLGLKNGDINTGFFFVWKGSTVAPFTGDGSATDFRKCYYASLSGINYNGICNQNYAPIVQVMSLKGILSDPTGAKAGDSGTNWKTLINPTNPLQSSWAQKMPVGVVNYKMGDPTKKTFATVGSSDAERSCLKEGNRLIDEGINWTLGNAGKAKQLEKLRALLVDGSGGDGGGDKFSLAPAGAGGTLSLDQIYDVNPALCGTQRGAAKSGGPSCSYASQDLPMANEIINAYDSAESQAAAHGGAELSPTQRYDTLLKLVLDSMDGSTTMFRAKVATGEQAKANAKVEADATSINMNLVGSSALTTIGGMGAMFFGTIVTGLGALITGPVAYAIVYFLSLLVDMALLILIVLTPIMFFIALAMPGAAIGVLTISVMGAFILKAVPITLLIINNIGGMVYVMIGASGSDKADTLQNLMIIAMGGLYANIVGLTFFLMFKLGDPNAVLSRFTALDSTAKQIADRGMELTIATAAVAASAAAAVGGSAFGLAALKKSAGNMISAAGGNPALVSAAVDELGEQNNKPETPEEKEQRLAEEAAAANTLTDEQKEKYSALEQQRLLDPRGQMDFSDKLMGENLTKEQEEQLIATGGLQLEDGTTYKMGDYDDPVWSFSKTQEMTKEETRMHEMMEGGYGSVRSIGGGGGSSDSGDGGNIPSTPSSPTPVLNETPPAANGQPQLPPPAAGNQGTGTGQQTDEDRAAAAAAPAGAAGVAQQVTVTGGQLTSVGSVGEITNMPPQAENKMQEKLAEKKAEQDANTLIESKAHTQALANDNMLPKDMREKLADVVQKYDANGLTVEDVKTLDNEREQILLSGGLSSDKMRNIHDQIAGMKTSMKPHFDAIDMKEANIAKFKANNKDLQGVNMEAALKANNLTWSDTEQKTKELREKLNSTDAVALVEGGLAQQLGSLSNFTSSMQARIGADKLPGYAQTMLSGFYGSVSGAGGGLARIPIIGPAIGESLNEFYQAPERAKAWNSIGGFGKWRDAQGDAQRMGFYQKEMGPIGAAAQYQAMSSQGGFQVQAELAQQTAREAVAKSRSMFESMMASRKDQVVSEIVNQVNASDVQVQLEHKLKTIQSEPLKAVLEDYPDMNEAQVRFLKEANPLQARMMLNDNEVNARFLKMAQQPGFQLAMSSAELYGLGRMEASDRVASVRQEAMIMQGPSFKSKVAKRGLDGEMMLKPILDSKDQPTGKFDIETEEVASMITADLLNKVHAATASKKVAGGIDDLRINHYGLMDKQYLRGTYEWDRTRNMSRSAAAASAFARQDVSTDYLITGHLKMVEGKLRYKESSGQYKTLVEFKNKENHMADAYLQAAIKQAQIAAGAGAPVTAGYAKIMQDLEGTKFKMPKTSHMSTSAKDKTQREMMEKWAKDRLEKADKLLPLESIFNEAYSNGINKYIEKSRLAPANMRSQAANTRERVQKAYVDALESAPNFNVNALNRKMVMSGKTRDTLESWSKELERVVSSKIVDSDDDLAPVINKLIQGMSGDSDAQRVRTLSNFSGKIDTKTYKDAAQAVYGINEKSYLAAYNSLDKAMQSKFDEAFQKVGDEYVFASLTIDNNGHTQRGGKFN